VAAHRVVGLQAFYYRLDSLMPNAAAIDAAVVVIVAERDISGLYMAIWHHRVRKGLPL
jgi:hypothetical protein